MSPGLEHDLRELHRQLAGASTAASHALTSPAAPLQVLAIRREVQELLREVERLLEPPPRVEPKPVQLEVAL